MTYNFPFVYCADKPCLHNIILQARTSHHFRHTHNGCECRDLTATSYASEITCGTSAAAYNGCIAPRCSPRVRSLISLELPMYESWNGYPLAGSLHDLCSSQLDHFTVTLG